MNEQIRKLAEEAGGEFYSGFAGSFDTVKFREEDLVRFAELVWAEAYQAGFDQGRQPVISLTAKQFGIVHGQCSRFTLCSGRKPLLGPG
jgi:hypothetical protein